MGRSLMDGVYALMGLVIIAIIVGALIGDKPYIY